MAEYIDKQAAIEACCSGCNPAVCSHDCDEVAAIRSIPAADVRPVKWKSVREYTPEPGRYLTCRKSMTTPPSYYCSILSYTDNLESIDEYDFEGERIPGWFEYDSEYGYYSCDNVEWFMPLPPMPPNCGAMMEKS